MVQPSRGSGYITDAELQIRAADGDLVAVAELYRRHYRSVLNYLTARPTSHWRVGRALTEKWGWTRSSGDSGTWASLSLLASELDDICAPIGDSSAPAGRRFDAAAG